MRLSNLSLTRSTLTNTAVVLAEVNGRGFRFAGGMEPAAPALPPGATPSRGYAGIDPPTHRPGRDCQSPRQGRGGLTQVAGWRPTQAAKPADPN